MNSFLNQPGSQPIAWGYADSGCHERGADLFDYALMGLIAFLLSPLVLVPLALVALTIYGCIRDMLG